MALHYKQKHIYVGVDLHKKTHTAVIIDCWHENLGEITFENKPSAFDELTTYVKTFMKRGMTPIYGWIQADMEERWPFTLLKINRR